MKKENKVKGVGGAGGGLESLDVGYRHPILNLGGQCH